MLVGTILRAKKKKTKAKTHLFSMRSSKGLERMLWIATRAILNTSVSKQTILNLACSVIHPTPDEQKQIIILLTAKQTWFIELLIQFRQFLATKTLFLRCHCLALFTRCCRFFLLHLVDLYHLTHSLPDRLVLGKEDTRVQTEMVELRSLR